MLPRSTTLQVEYERTNGALTQVNFLPAQDEATGPNGEFGLSKDAGQATNLILTSFDRFFNKQIWSPLIGGDVFQIQMTRPAGECEESACSLSTLLALVTPIVCSCWRKVYLLAPPRGGSSHSLR
jgi:hypothetical protein